MKQCKRLEKLLQRKSGATSMEIIAAHTLERAMKALDHIKARGGIRAVA